MVYKCSFFFIVTISVMICRWLISRLTTTNGLSLYCFDSTTPKDVFGSVKKCLKSATKDCIWKRRALELCCLNGALMKCDFLKITAAKWLTHFCMCVNSICWKIKYIVPSDLTIASETCSLWLVYLLVNRPYRQLLPLSVSTVCFTLAVCLK